VYPLHLPTCSYVHLSMSSSVAHDRSIARHA
jgi:hypothetical protein